MTVKFLILDMELQFFYKFTLTSPLAKFLIILFNNSTKLSAQTTECSYEYGHPVEEAGILYGSWKSDESRFQQTVEYSALAHSRIFRSSHSVDFNENTVTHFFPRPELIVFALGLFLLIILY